MTLEEKIAKLEKELVAYARRRERAAERAFLRGEVVPAISNRWQAQVDRLEKMKAKLARGTRGRR